MEDQVEKRWDDIEIYVLANWEHFEAMKWPRPDMAIRYYQEYPLGLARDKVAVERKREAASERVRHLRESGARATVDPVTHAIIEQVRMLDAQGLSQEEIARETGYVIHGVANALRIIKGKAPLDDIHVKRLNDNLERMDDDVR